MKCAGLFIYSFSDKVTISSLTEHRSNFKVTDYSTWFAGVFHMNSSNENKNCDVTLPLSSSRYSVTPLKFWKTINWLTVKLSLSCL